MSLTLRTLYSYRLHACRVILLVDFPAEQGLANRRDYQAVLCSPLRSGRRIWPVEGCGRGGASPLKLWVAPMDRAWAPPGPAMLFAAALAGCLLSSVLAVCVPSDAVFPGKLGAQAPQYPSLRADASSRQPKTAIAGGCKLQVMSSPYLAIHWIPTAGVEPTVQLGMESEPSSYSAVAFGGTSGMDGSYIILGYNDGSTGEARPRARRNSRGTASRAHGSLRCCAPGFVGTYRGQGHVTPVSTSDVTITDAQTRTQDGVMIWSATLTLSIPNVSACPLLTSPFHQPRAARASIKTR